MDMCAKGVYVRYAPYIVLVGVLLAAILIRILPYIVNDYFFEIGFDTGYYESLLTRYAEADSWTKAPAYPPMTDREAFPIEPGFFIIITFIYDFSPGAVNIFFRYFLPGLMGSLMSLGIFLLLIRRTDGNMWLGVLGALLMAVSYVQVDSVNSSYYRQIMASFLLMIAIWRLDLISGKGGLRGIAFMSLIVASLIALHRAVFLIFLIIVVSLFVYNIIKRNNVENRCLIIVALFAAFLSAPFWIHSLDYQIWTISTIFQDSFLGISEQLNDGFNYQGGGVPEYFSRNGVLESYVWLFPCLFIAGILGAGISIVRKIDRPIVMGFVFLIVYVGLWFAFGNRLILNLDIFIIFFCCMMILFLSKLELRKFKKYRNIVTILIVAGLLIGPTAFIVDTQMQKKPIITQNIEGAEWMVENIPTDESIIFAPDYLSASFLQMGYNVAFVDYRFSTEGERPTILNEMFLNQSAYNTSFLKDFFDDYNWVEDLDIYVIWGVRETEVALANTLLMIPENEYISSPWFEMKYEGSNEILRIYHFTG